VLVVRTENGCINHVDAYDTTLGGLQSRTKRYDRHGSPRTMHAVADQTPGAPAASLPPRLRSEMHRWLVHSSVDIIQLCFAQLQ
jgi:hypothetical protein